MRQKSAPDSGTLSRGQDARAQESSRRNSQFACKLRLRAIRRATYAIFRPFLSPLFRFFRQSTAAATSRLRSRLRSKGRSLRIRPRIAYMSASATSRPRLSGSSSTVEASKHRVSRCQALSCLDCSRIQPAIPWRLSSSAKTARPRFPDRVGPTPTIGDPRKLARPGGETSNSLLETLTDWSAYLEQNARTHRLSSSTGGYEVPPDAHGRSGHGP